MAAAGRGWGTAGGVAREQRAERRYGHAALPDGERQQSECARQYTGAKSDRVLPQAGFDRVRQAMVRHERLCATDDGGIWQHGEERVLRAGHGDLRCSAVPQHSAARGGGTAVACRCIQCAEPSDVCESWSELDEHDLWPGDGHGGFESAGVAVCGYGVVLVLVARAGVGRTGDCACGACSLWSLTSA